MPGRGTGESHGRPALLTLAPRRGAGFLPGSMPTAPVSARAQSAASGRAARPRRSWWSTASASSRSAPARAAALGLHLPGVGPGARYGFKIDGGPAVRSGLAAAGLGQLEGWAVGVAVSGTGDGRRGLAGTVPGGPGVYELHVGTFTAEGTWRAAAAKLPHLASLGVTMIEMMPMPSSPAASAGATTASAYAPTGSTARPTTSAVRRCRAPPGIGVILDVVYNHFGPGNPSPRSPTTSSPPATARVGHGDQFRRAGGGTGPRLSSPRTPATGSTSSTSTACGSTRPRRSSTLARHIVTRIARDARAARARRMLLVAENEPQDAKWRGRPRQAATASTRCGTTTSTTPPTWR